MNLVPAKKPCNTCGMQISWDQLARERLNWRGPLNLDGSQHRHTQNSVIAAPPLQQSFEENSVGIAGEGPTSTTSQAIMAAVDERRNAIQRAHDENMKSGEELRQSIDGLATHMSALGDTLISIDKTLVVLSETIKAYLDLPK